MRKYDLMLTHVFGVDGTYRSADAFTALYERTHLIVFRYIYALHGEPQEDAEDLWHETYMRAWRSRHRFSGSEAAALGWLLRIARNLVIDKHRHHQRYPISNLSDTETFSGDSDETPENLIVLQEQYQVLWKMLDGLSEQQREMVILRYIVGWRVKEIAAHLQIPENTISVNLRRVLAKLANQQEKDNE